MNKKTIHSTGALLLISGIVAVSIVVKLLLNSGEIAQGLAPAAQVAQTQTDATVAGPINGKYSGQVELDGVATGIYSDNLTVAAGQPDLGSVDLSLQLSQTDNALSGYVALDKTLIFSVEHTLDGQPPLPIGPYVAGTFDGATFTLQSERVSLVLAGQQIWRQFRLLGAVDATGTTLTGEYRETLWGYVQQPITTIGTFTLIRPDYSGAALPPSTTPTPVPPLPSSQNSIYLPLIQR